MSCCNNFTRPRKKISDRKPLSTRMASPLMECRFKTRRNPFGEICPISRASSGIVNISIAISIRQQTYDLYTNRETFKIEPFRGENLATDKTTATLNDEK
jgi:hypothetical protein